MPKWFLLLAATATAAVTLAWFTPRDTRPPCPEVDLRPFAPQRQPLSWFPAELAHVPEVSDGQRRLWTHDYLAWRGAVLGLLTHESNPLRLDEAEQARLAELIAEERWSMGAILAYACPLARRTGIEWISDPNLAEITDRAPEERFLERALPALAKLGASGASPETVELPDCLLHPGPSAELDYEMLPDSYLSVLPEGRRRPSFVRLGRLAELASQRLTGAEAARGASELRGLVGAIGLHARRWGHLQAMATRGDRATLVVAEGMRLSAARRVDLEAARQQALGWYEDWAEEHPDEHGRVVQGLVPSPDVAVGTLN